MLSHVATTTTTRTVTGPAAAMSDGPFGTIEDAHEYVTLLVETAIEARGSIQEQLHATPASRGRSVDVLRLVDFKICQLQAHLSQSARILNDLRSLRRLILNEREDGRA